MAYERNDYAGAAAETTLAAGINGSDTSISITASTGWPSGSNGAFVAVIDAGTASEEKVLVTTRTGTTLNTVTRGYDGTSAASHSSGATIAHCIAAVDLDEANYWVAELAAAVNTAGDLAVADGNNSLTTLAKGSNSTVLQVSSGGTLQYGTVTSAMITDGTIASGDLADSAVTTAKIAAAAVDENKLATSVAGSGLAGGGGSALSVNVDDTTLAIATDTLSIKDGGVTAAKIAAAVAGDGLTGGGGSALAVSTDGSTLEINADALRVKAAGIGLSHISLASDPSNSTDAARKNYVDTKGQQGILNRSVTSPAGPFSLSSGSQIGSTITITDPGYNIYVWGHGTVAPYTVSQTVNPSIWVLEILVDNVVIDSLRVPFFTGVAAAISMGVPLRTTSHSTGSNCTVKMRATRATGDGSLQVDADGTYNCLQVYWVRQ